MLHIGDDLTHIFHLQIGDLQVFKMLPFFPEVLFFIFRLFLLLFISRVIDLLCLGKLLPDLFAFLVFLKSQGFFFVRKHFQGFQFGIGKQESLVPMTFHRKLPIETKHDHRRRILPKGLFRELLHFISIIIGQQAHRFPPF